MIGDPFGGALQLDPAVALPRPALPAAKLGPLHRIEFVIELVGPRSVPAGAACRLLDADWHGALGSPTCWVMRPADTSWQPLTNSQDGSYDSVALTWRILTPRGNLTQGAAERLLSTATKFGEAIGRRAIPMPLATDIGAIAKDLTQVAETLDVGTGCAVAGPHPWLERDIWIACSALGLEFVSPGEFAWQIDGRTLFTVSPAGTQDTFSLASVNSGITHEGLSMGFRIATSPDPEAALRGMWHTAKVLANRLRGLVFTESELEWTPALESASFAELTQALALFREARIVPGSPEALAVFGE